MLPGNQEVARAAYNQAQTSALLVLDLKDCAKQKSNKVRALEVLVGGLCFRWVELC